MEAISLLKQKKSPIKSFHSSGDISHQANDKGRNSMKTLLTMALFLGLCGFTSPVATAATNTAPKIQQSLADGAYMLKMSSGQKNRVSITNSNNRITMKYLDIPQMTPLVWTIKNGVCQALDQKKGSSWRFHCVGKFIQANTVSGTFTRGVPRDMSKGSFMLYRTGDLKKDKKAKASLADGLYAFWKKASWERVGHTYKVKLATKNNVTTLTYVGPRGKSRKPMTWNTKNGNITSTWKSDETPFTYSYTGKITAANNVVGTYAAGTSRDMDKGPFSLKPWPTLGAP